MTTPLETARECWGSSIPDWVELLATECCKISQNKVAKKLNRSAALVSAVLRNRYAGDMEAVEEVVRGVFQSATVDCPAMGTMPSNICRDWQLKARSFSNENSERVRMFRACQRCSRFRNEVQK